MVKALIIGDPHFKVGNIKEMDQMIEKIVNVAEKKEPDIIIVLGDVLDRHETIHVIPLTRAIKFIKKLKEICKTYVLIGNHDLKNNREYLSEEHPFYGLKDIKNIEIIDKPIKEKIKDKIFVFTPYVPKGRFLEALNTIENWEEAKCIFAHQEFKGAKMGAIISEDGDEWDLNNPLVITGHIHDYQEPQKNIIYTGTPIQHSFGDNTKKTISYVEFTNKKDFYYNHERIDLGLPKKILIRLKFSDVCNYVPPDNTIIKIIIKGTSPELKSIIKHPNISYWKSLGHKISYKDIPSDDDNQCINNKDVSIKFSNLLFNSIKDNNDLIILYNEIFSNI